MKKWFLCLMLCVLASLSSFAQKSATIDEYIRKDIELTSKEQCIENALLSKSDVEELRWYSLAFMKDRSDTIVHQKVTELSTKVSKDEFANVIVPLFNEADEMIALPVDTLGNSKIYLIKKDGKKYIITVSAVSVPY